MPALDETGPLQCTELKHELEHRIGRALSTASALQHVDVAIEHARALGEPTTYDDAETLRLLVQARTSLIASRDPRKP